MQMTIRPQQQSWRRSALAAIAATAIVVGLAVTAMAGSNSLSGKSITGDSRLGSQAITHPSQYQPKRSENAKGRLMSRPKVPDPPQRELVGPRASIPDPSPQLIRKGFIPLGGNSMGGPKNKVSSSQYGTTAYLQPRPIILGPPRDPNHQHRETVPDPTVRRAPSIATRASTGSGLSGGSK
jgi:hypothetical protein